MQSGMVRSLMSFTMVLHVLTETVSDGDTAWRSYKQIIKQRC